MATKLIHLDMRQIHDWESFHDLFAGTFGFPDYYGRNMNAWIDCMDSLGDPDDSQTSVHAPPGGAIVLHLDHVQDFAARCPEIYDAIIECAAFVNYMRIEQNEQPILMLSFHE